MQEGSAKFYFVVHYPRYSLVLVRAQEALGCINHRRASGMDVEGWRVAR